MTVYDFTTRPDRLDQASMKWKTSESQPDLLQMWVADMDFLPVPEVRQALMDYAQDHVFGYPYVRDSLYQAIMDWERENHGYAIEQDKIVLIEGVVPAISTAIQALTEEGDAILINTPIYPPFARSIRLNNRKLVTNSLLIEDGRFELDFDQLEKDIVDQKVKMYILCNPHNPGGRVWGKDDLRKIGQLCKRYGVLLVSDEIHQDLALFGNTHHSFNTVDASFKEFSLVLGSATKTFNMAGTKNSFAIIENDRLRKAFVNRQLANNQHEIPTVGLIATEVAFRKGGAWLVELKQVLEENITYVYDYLAKHSSIKAMKPEGTYLIWLDFSAYNLTHADINRLLQEEAKLVLNDGLTFGREGKQFARLNIATPLATVKEACQRLVKVFPKL